MLQRKACADHILLLGVDGMDPRLTRRYVDRGLMPNLAEYIRRGACREDLIMLGAHPTVTPPMWTTLACGCYPNVHGITGFQRLSTDDIDAVAYNLDSRRCLAEPLWNVFAEAGKRTLVWHWPGSSWPPTSDSENLMVVDGTSPGSVGMATSQVEGEFLVGANEAQSELRFVPKVPLQASHACMITDLDLDAAEPGEYYDIMRNVSTDTKSTRSYVTSYAQMTTSMTEAPYDLVQSPIRPAAGWADAPADAKEFVLLFSHGLIHRPALVLKNAQGVYDRVAIYKKKKDPAPLAICPLGQMVAGVIDEAIKGETTYRVNRNLKLLRLDPEGRSLTLFVSAAMDTANDDVWHPKRLFQEVTEHVGYPTPTCLLGRQDSMLILECMLSCWDVTADWQAAALHELIEREQLDVVFSHYHEVDAAAHVFFKHLADKPFNRNPVALVEKWAQAVYQNTDYYLGKFLHLLDEGWTICIFSDHGIVAPKHDMPVFIEVGGTNIYYMEKLGLTIPIRNEQGEVTGIDWTRTRAVCQREGHIYLNIKGRNRHGDIDGLIDPADQYEVEEEIMTKLYQLTDEKTGHRLISIALRNRDAILLGMGGPESGDIIFWQAEGYNFEHADCLSTTLGESGTSVSPIFIGAGPGFKSGCYTDRVIREVDFAPTIAVLGGVRMPRECEGAPVYQILAEQY